MVVEYGMWEVSQGKGDRYYIRSLDNDKIMHPEDLTGLNGCGMYDFKSLQDLALAIIKFEKEKNHKSSILGKLDGI